MSIKLLFRILKNKIVKVKKPVYLTYKNINFVCFENKYNYEGFEHTEIYLYCRNKELSKLTYITTLDYNLLSPVYTKYEIQLALDKYVERVQRIIEIDKKEYI